MLNILLSGVGGQGTVLASKLLARCAMLRGETAHTAETIGMAQRGGSVVSHVRIGNDVFSPLIPHGCADVIIAFEPAEAVRVLPYLKQGGAAVVCTTAVKPVTDALSDSSYHAASMTDYLRLRSIRTVFLDGDAVLQACGSIKPLNMALLGAAASAGLIGVSPEELLEALNGFLPEKFLDVNRKAISVGTQAGKNKL